MNLQVCESLADQIEKKKLITAAGYLLRYESLFQKVKELVERNTISTVRICNYAYLPEVHWWHKMALSGGMMVEAGCHYVDLLRYLFGEIGPVAALTSDGIAKKNNPNTDIYDSMEGILKFENGAVASIGVTHVLNKIFARNDMLEIYGEDFALKIDLFKLRYKDEAKAVYKEKTDKEWKEIVNESTKALLLQRQSEAFLLAVQDASKNSIKSSYGDAVNTLKVVLALNDSAKTHSFN